MTNDNRDNVVRVHHCRNLVFCLYKFLYSKVASNEGQALAA